MKAGKNLYDRNVPREACPFSTPICEIGESLEEKVRRITTTREPIENSAPMIYTDRKDGVLPQYDIRTDRWEIAQNAMDKVQAMEIAKRKSQDEPSEQKNEPTKNE